MGRKLFHGVVIATLSAIIALVLYQQGYLAWMENPLWSLRVRASRGPSDHTDNIRLVLIDDNSLKWGSETNHWSWPWPRSVHRALIDFAQRGKASCIVFDMTFTEPDAKSPMEDTLLATSMSTSCVPCVTAMFTGHARSSISNWPSNIRRDTLPVIEGWDDFLHTDKAQHLMTSSAQFPLSPIANGAHMLGNVFISTEQDRVIRRIEPFHIFNKQFVPSLGLAAFLTTHPNCKMRIDPHGLWIDKQCIPLDEHGRAILNYRGKALTFPFVSAQALIQSEIRIRNNAPRPPVLDPKWTSQSIILYGSTATALFDLKSAPIGDSMMPGVEIHATFLDNLLANDVIADTPWPLTIAFVFLFAVMAGTAGRFSDSAFSFTGTLAVYLILPLLPAFIAYDHQLWLPVAPALVAVLIALITAVTLNYAMEGHQRRFIKSAFKQYLNHTIIDELLAHPERLKLGGETRTLSIFFSDIAGFTSISERLTPEKLTNVLNDYLDQMSEIILSEAGTINKFMGDAIIAFWNAPIEQADHALRAVRAALKCQKKLLELATTYEAEAGHPIAARIGLNTGPVTVGNMGSNHLFDYTFFGDNGNLASRLEGVNKVFGTSILISETTLREFGDEIPCREIAAVRVVGKKQPVRIYEPALPEDLEAIESRWTSFEKGRALFYDGKFTDALSVFKQTANEDPVANAYANRCRLWIDNPPEMWEGVWELTSK